MCVCSVDTVFFPYFSLLFLSFFSCNCAGFVLVFLSHSFLHFIFSFCMASFHLFILLILSLDFLLFFHTFDKIHCTFLSFLYFLPSPPFSQTFSFSQHWNTGGSHPEELERPGTHPRLKARSQPPMFHPFISTEPQFTDCVALSEHSIPGHQIALQMNIAMKNY